MPWIRLCDNYVDDEKFQALSDGAFRLWHEAMSYCRRHQTDGLIPFSVMRGLRSFTKGREKQLAAPAREALSPLWELIAGTGYKVHNYLAWNLSKEEEQAKQTLNNHRGAFFRDRGLRTALRERDQDLCRYCAISVNWADRKGASGATYDHIDPRGPMTMDNLVIACRGCNSRKRNRRPEEAGLVLLPVPQIPDSDLLRSRSDLGRISDSTGMGVGIESTELDLLERESERKPDVISADQARFDTFWASYPRKVGKDAARKAWQKRRPSEELLQAMLAAVDWQKRTDAWLKSGGQYVPHPSTWLNEGRWQDEPQDTPRVSDRTIGIARAAQDFLHDRH